MLELTELFHAFLFLESVKHVERETRMGGGGREEGGKSYRDFLFNAYFSFVLMFCNLALKIDFLFGFFLLLLLFCFSVIDNFKIILE